MPTRSENDLIADVCDYASERVQDKIGSTLAHLGKLCESPIERVMAAAIVAVFEIEEGWPLIFLPTAECLFKGNVNLGIAPQAQVGDWRVDFLLIDRTLKRPLSVIIECDGHQFHERDQDQALRDRSRDRAAQAIGAHVFRFTGREIWKDPIKCAREVFDLLERAAREEERSEP